MLPNTSSSAIAVSGVGDDLGALDVLLRLRAHLPRHLGEPGDVGAQQLGVACVNSGESRSAVSTRSPSPPSSVPMMSAWWPSVLFNGGAFESVQYERRFDHRRIGAPASR